MKDLPEEPAAVTPTPQKAPRRKPNTKGMGRIYLRDKRWWIQYGFEGSNVREPAPPPHDEQAAKDLLRARITEIENGTFAPKARRLTIKDLAEKIRANYKTQKRRSTDRLETSLAHLEGHFMLVKAPRIPTRAEAYVAARQKDGVTDATIRLELLVLLKALKLSGLAHVASKLREYIPARDKSTVRKGFATVTQLGAIVRHLPDHLKGFAVFAFWSMWRLREVTGLTWDAVDEEAGVIRIGGDATKNMEPRSVPYASCPELADVIKAQRASADEIQRRTGHIVTHVFHTPRGTELRDFRGSWSKATGKALRPATLIHDLRRSGARAWSLRGMPEAFIQQLGGWRTTSTFKAYQVFTFRDLADAMERATGHTGASTEQKEA